MDTALTDYPVTVVAEILPGKPDPSSRAAFANASRAGAYATMLWKSGDYSGVFIRFADGDVFPLT